ncbi:MAG TPA: HEAT repeat domain-containing protein [Allosphingosinicella sp.]|jgi:hypothetical protein
MISGDALAAWFEDRNARGRSAAAVERFGRAFRERPEFATLAAELDDARGLGAGPVLAAAARYLADEAAVEAALAAMIGAARDDPFFRPPLRTPMSEIHTGLILFDHPALTIFVAVMSPDSLAAKRTFRDGAASISFGGQQAIYRFLRSGGATLSFWQAPELGAGFVGDPDLRCRLAGRRAIADGETVPLDGRREAFVIEHAVSDLVYLQALTPIGAAPVMAEFDSATLAFVGASSTDEIGSRVGTMVSLLRAMDRTDAAPLFAEALRTAHFHGRWHVMREFLALDADRALPYLRNMAVCDPHPEVRAAAAQTLALFFPPSPVREELPCHA